ncbi:MAG: prolipoprotein diacylglyceryl transferase [Candidatus Krumholzibacteria bacterium]|nr:prolipoprotein diacylglyceryl transferase [Candidatus Krumholzibacteria bacterium]
MHPILVKVGWFNIYAFGLMLAMSFLAGIYVSSYRAKRFGVNPQYILDLSVYLILSGVIGSRLLYVVFHLEEYNSVLDIFALWQGGATLYGGFLLAIFVSYVFSKRKNIDFFLIADILAPALALGIMLTRVGCYLSGCCFGSETALPWGVVFPPESPAGTYQRGLSATAGGVATLHPAQLYASIYGLVIFLGLMLSEKRLIKRGATFGALLVLYGLFRFTLDFFRYYEQNMKILMGITLNQIISVVLLGVGLYLLARKTNLETRAGSR